MGQVVQHYLTIFNLSHKPFLKHCPESLHVVPDSPQVVEQWVRTSSVTAHIWQQHTPHLLQQGQEKE